MVSVVDLLIAVGKIHAHLVTRSVTSEVFCVIIKGNSQRKKDSREELGFSPNKKKKKKVSFFLTEREKIQPITILTYSLSLKILKSSFFNKIETSVQICQFENQCHLTIKQ